MTNMGGNERLSRNISATLSLSPCLQSRLTHPIPHHGHHHHHHHVAPQVCCEVQRAADPHPGGGRVLLQAATCLQAGTSPQHYAGRRSIGNFRSLKYGYSDVGVFSGSG